MAASGGYIFPMAAKKKRVSKKVKVPYMGMVSTIKEKFKKAFPKPLKTAGGLAKAALKFYAHNKGKHYINRNEPLKKAGGAQVK